jgi:hypothetical protein
MSRLLNHAGHFRDQVPWCNAVVMELTTYAYIGLLNHRSHFLKNGDIPSIETSVNNYSPDQPQPRVQYLFGVDAKGRADCSDPDIFPQSNVCH